jgi:hypothetical protein
MSRGNVFPQVDAYPNPRLLTEGRGRGRALEAAEKEMAQVPDHVHTSESSGFKPVRPESSTGTALSETPVLLNGHYSNLRDLHLLERTTPGRLAD